MDKKIIEIVGEETKRWEFESGIVFIYREPSTREIVNYKNSIHYRRRGKDFVTKAAEPQIVLADAILIDVEGLGFPDLKKKPVPLTKNTTAEEMAHLKTEGGPPRNWKELVPARLKTRFIDELIVGVEEEEKN